MKIELKLPITLTTILKARTHISKKSCLLPEKKLTQANLQGKFAFKDIFWNDMFH